MNWSFITFTFFSFFLTIVVPSSILNCDISRAFFFAFFVLFQVRFYLSYVTLPQSNPSLSLVVCYGYQSPPSPLLLGYGVHTLCINPPLPLPNSSRYFASFDIHFTILYISFFLHLPFTQSLHVSLHTHPISVT